MWLAAPTLAGAACAPEADHGSVTVESCPIARTGAGLIRSRTTADGTVGAVVLLLLADVERAAGAAPAHRSTVHEVTGRGVLRRVVVSRRSWWRLDGGGVVLDVVGADDLATHLQGIRVRCLRSRWTIIAGGAPGTVAILNEAASDPRPPFGLAGLVTQATARVMHARLTLLRRQLGGAGPADGPDLSAWPLLTEPLPPVAADFAACLAR